MKITFIRPNMRPERSGDAIHPLELAVLIGLTPPGIEVELYDERVEDVPLDRPTGLVAITVQTFTARRAYEIADAYRARGVPVVMGGYHPTFLPGEARAHADAVVVGEAEGIWPEIVADALRGELATCYRYDGDGGLDTVRYDRRLFAGKRYSGIFPVEFNRGCPYRCDFCSIGAFHRHGYKTRPVDALIREIGEASPRFVYFVDDNILCDRGRTRELLRALVPLRIRWGCQVSIDIARDRELLDLMEESGCEVALVGFESLSGENLRQMRKGANLGSVSFDEDIRKIRDRGIMICGSFIFGYDDDTPGIFDRTLDFAMRHRLFLANFNTLNPMPGTRLYERLRREQRLVREEWWLDPGCAYGEVVFHPRRMTRAELRDGCRRVRGEFYSRASICRRAPESMANGGSLSRLALHFAVNRLVRAEIRRKMLAP